MLKEKHLFPIYLNDITLLKYYKVFFKIKKIKIKIKIMQYEKDVIER